jgi:predicted Ser/Thr protein kinase
MKCEACGHENIDGARFCAGCGALVPVDAEGEDPLIGQVIGGRYRITGVLGEGGMGVVYAGEQQMGSTVRKVAVKTLHPHLSQDDSVLQRFHRECGTVAGLEHPNTIKFYDFGATADGTLYIAMEFVKGKSLDQVIEAEGAQPPDRVVRIMKQVCGALEEAHQQGIIHRDLKPENIILTDLAGEADSVKVLDFGIAARSESADAKKEQKLTQQGMVLGTPPYMSPEQFTGKELDARSDIYSLGVMAYELLTGRLPFEADTPWQWATQHMTAQPAPMEVTAPTSSVPNHLRTAVMRALSKDRDQRQKSAQEFFAELSGGGGLTLNEPIPASFGSAGTAEMAAAPDFGAAAALAAAAPAGVPGVAPGAAVPQGAAPGGMAPAPVPAVQPPPARSGGDGGLGKLLILGLVGLLGLLTIAIVVVVVRSMKPADEPEGPLANPFESSEPISVTSELPDAAAQAADSSAAGTAAAADATSAPTSTSTSPAATSTSTTPQPRPTSTSTSPPPSSGGGNACDACISAARGGNITGALASYRRCNDAGKKATCSDRARTRAAAAAKTAARNGQCPQAKAIITAAKAMGAGSGRLDGALAGTSCQ